MAYEQRHGDSDSKVSCSLRRYLRQQQSKLDGNLVLEQKKLIMKFKAKALNGRRFVEESQNDDQVVKESIFNTKTMEVHWEGEPCYMHVFIDNTDILKLEEANNNIKLQKVMFASISHEFRTPLNAIMNSYNFIDDTYK